MPHFIITLHHQAVASASLFHVSSITSRAVVVYTEEYDHSFAARKDLR